jgi:hypothetical protein
MVVLLVFPDYRDGVRGIASLEAAGEREQG